MQSDIVDNAPVDLRVVLAREELKPPAVFRRRKNGLHEPGLARRNGQGAVRGAIRRGAADGLEDFALAA